MEGQRFFGKDRVEWLAEEIAESLGRASYVT
jgi:hypothetical protein